jgi:hypothetical protein
METQNLSASAYLNPRFRSSYSYKYPYDVLPTRMGQHAADCDTTFKQTISPVGHGSIQPPWSALEFGDPVGKSLNLLMADVSLIRYRSDGFACFTN